MEPKMESERAAAERTSFKSVLWMSLPCVPASLNDALTSFKSVLWMSFPCVPASLNDVETYFCFFPNDGVKRVS